MSDDWKPERCPTCGGNAESKWGLFGHMGKQAKAFRVASKSLPACTCLPLNRRLMARLLKVTEGSVHEQGCWEAAALASPSLDEKRLARAIRTVSETQGSYDWDWVIDYDEPRIAAAIARAYVEDRP